MSEFENEIELTVELAREETVRADLYVSDYAKILNRSQLKNRNMEISINGNVIKASKKVKSGDKMTVSFDNPEPVNIEPEDIALEIIFEDNSAIVIDKPQGMVVHPGAGNYSGTMAQGLLHRFNEEGNEFQNDDTRPGIVHRLDKDTSGVIIAAKNPEALEFLASQFRNKTAKKIYIALVRGRMERSSGVIDTFITRDPGNRKKFTVSESKGKHAVTSYTTVAAWDDFSFIRLSPKTGRTHQLRVHMKHIGHPIIGDPLYGKKTDKCRSCTLMLHAYSLSVMLPGREKPGKFISPVPSRFRKAMLEFSIEAVEVDKYFSEVQD